MLEHIISVFRPLAASHASVGVIGGADGPTAIFISAKPYWWLELAIPAVALAIVLIIVLRRRHKDK